MKPKNMISKILQIRKGPVIIKILLLNRENKRK